MIVTQGNEGIRWGRALLAAILVEVLLAVIAVPVVLSAADPASTLNLIVAPASFLAALLVVMWLFRNAARPVANGVATGVICLLIYLVLAGASYWLAPERINLSQSLGLTYLASHLLKIAGGWAGGWWIARKRTAASAETFE